MADKTDKFEDNAPGKYYIDKTCTYCLVCNEEAPDNIKESDDGDHSYISKQPENDDEIEQMENAIDSCPTESIGDDGA